MQQEHVKDDGHHPEAVGGWDYYSSVFEVGGKYFSGTVKLLVDAKGRRRFHDVTEIKEETLSQVDASTTQGHSALLDGMSHEVLQGTNSNRGSSTGDTIPKSGQNGNGVAKMSVGRLYTGSAADYEKPSLLKVGTGEGSQVYGWGLYASEVRDIAEGYAKGTHERPKELGTVENKKILKKLS